MAKITMYKITKKLLCMNLIKFPSIKLLQKSLFTNLIKLLLMLLKPYSV